MQRRHLPGALTLIVASTLGRPILAATCQTTDAVPEFSWNAIGDTTPDVAWDCTGDGQPDESGDAGGPNDHYVIQDDHTVRLVGDVVQDAASSSGLFVRADDDGNGTPGALVADVLATPQPRRLRLSLGSTGLACLGRCELLGAYREVGSGSPGLLPEPHATAFFEAGELVFCPGEGASVEPDCNGGLPTPGASHTVRLLLSDPLVVAPAVAAIDPHDVLCRFDPVPEDATAFPDPNSCYEIVGTRLDPPAIDVDVRRGGQDPLDFPLARRQIAQTVLSADVEAGSLAACVDGSTATALGVFDREDSVLGRFLFLREGIEGCGDGDANPCRHESRGYKITRLDLDDRDRQCPSGHRITIGDVRGFREGHQAGEDVWIGYGLLGPFLVVTPVEVTSATALGGDSAVDFRGPTFVEGVLFDGIQKVRIRSSAVVERFAHFWLRDAGGGATSATDAVFILESDGADVGPGAITGARAETNCGSPADLPCGGFARGINVTASDTWLHDLFLWPTRRGPYQSAPTTVDNRLERIYAGPLVDDAGSVHFVVASGPMDLLRDAFCDGCSSAVTLVGTIDVVEGLTIWNGGGGVDPRAGANDLLVVGSRDGISVGGNLDGFVVRDSSLRGAVLSLVDRLQDLVAPGVGMFVRNGVVQRVRFKTQLIDYDDTPIIQPETPSLIENVGFFDVGSVFVDPFPIENRLFQFEGNPSEVARRITVAFTSDFLEQLGAAPNIRFGLFSFPGVTDFTNLTLDGLLLSGFRNDSSTIDFPADEDFAEVNWLNGPCLFDNDADTLPGRESLLPPTTVFGNPGFVDPESYRFDVQPGSLADQVGCGISSTRPPGILTKHWMHFVANLEPEFVPEPSGAGRLGASLGVVLLLAGRRRRSGGRSHDPRFPPIPPPLS